MTTAITPATIAEFKQYFESLNVNYRCIRDERGFTIYTILGQSWISASFGCKTAYSENSELEAWATAYKMFNEIYD